MSKPVKCFIVEGEARDYRFIQGMTRTFFKGRFESVTIFLPAKLNIYMLYNRLKAEPFDTDPVELLRDESEQARQALEGISRQQIDEVFLFFDFDIHQKNLSEKQNPFDILEKMIHYFDNETENGKLYISYPMVEALYDYQDALCEPFTLCRYPLNLIREYKKRAGLNNPSASRHLIRYEDWRMILSLFGLRIKCLFDTDKLDFSFYSKNITVESIFHLQQSFISHDKTIFVLSAFPEFLLDYFQVSFFIKHITRSKNKYNHCPKNIPLPIHAEKNKI